jgi:hypothetical protein
MKMEFRIAMICLVTIAVSGCAGVALKKEWSEKRGYSESEISEVMDQMQPYRKRLIASDMASNRFNTAPRQAEEATLKTVWCNCWKKLKDKCQQSSKGLSQEDRALWLKANAVEMAFAAGETALDARPNTKLDGAECP